MNNIELEAILNEAYPIDESVDISGMELIGVLEGLNGKDTQIYKDSENDVYLALEVDK